MKSSRLIVFLLIPLAASPLPAQPPGRGAGYPFKSAIVEYKIKGDFQQGKEILMIDEYGLKTYRERQVTTTLGGINDREDTVEIDDGKTLYRVDLKEGTAESAPSRNRRAMERAGRLGRLSEEERQSLEDLSEKIVRDITGQEVFRSLGRETILGRECDLYELFGEKTWYWNNLEMKKESHLIGKTVQTATRLKMNVPISAETFRLPGGVRMKEDASPPPGDKPREGLPPFNGEAGGEEGLGPVGSTR